MFGFQREKELRCPCCEGGIAVVWREYNLYYAYNPDRRRVGIEGARVVHPTGTADTYACEHCGALLQFNKELRGYSVDDGTAILFDLPTQKNRIPLGSTLPCPHCEENLLEPMVGFFEEVEVIWEKTSYRHFQLSELIPTQEGVTFKCGSCHQPLDKETCRDIPLEPLSVYANKQLPLYHEQQLAAGE